MRTLCLVGENEAVIRAYDASDGVCLPHLCLAMGRGRVASPLVERTLDKWDELGVLLDDFVKKHEYRGRPGVWANDLHLDPYPRRRSAGTARLGRG